MSTIMILPPTIPIVLLILGALAVAASDLARLRRPSLIMVLASGLALMTVLMLRSDTPVTQIVSAWQPVSVFSVPISFRVDHTTWIIGLGLTMAGVVTAITWLAYPGQQRPAPRALSLLLIAAAMASVFASNLLSLIVAWGLLDLVFIAVLLVRRGPHMGRRAAVAIVLNTGATVCVWIAALLIENVHGSLYWHLLNLTPAARAWLIAAAALRLGLYPLHQWLPIELGQEPDRAVLIFTVPSVVGFALWARLSIAQALPAEPIVQVMAMLSALVGAVLAWRTSPPRNSLPFIALSLSGLATIDAVTFNTPGLITAAALNWLFVIIGLFITRGLDRHSPWWSIGALIAGLSLIGLPGTLGFAVQPPLITHLIDAGQWPMLIGSLVAEILLVASTARLIFLPASAEQPIQLIRKISFGLAIGCAALPLIIAALVPTLVPGLPSVQRLINAMTPFSWLLWLLPIVLGLAIALRDRRAAALETPAAQPIWMRAARLEWFNAVVAFFVHRLAGLLRGLSSIVEGEGGLIWSVIIVMVGLVLATGALK